jgi:hypothetical protein
MLIKMRFNKPPCQTTLSVYLIKVKFSLVEILKGSQRHLQYFRLQLTNTRLDLCLPGMKAISAHNIDQVV